MRDIPGTPGVKPQSARTGTPGFVTKGEGLPVPRVWCNSSQTELTEVPGTGMEVLPNSQKFWVHRTVWKSYGTHRSSGFWGYECCIRTRTPTRVSLKGYIRTPGICATGVQNLQKFRVRVQMSCITIQIPVRVVPRVWFCTYPTQHNQLWKITYTCDRQEQRAAAARKTDTGIHQLCKKQFPTLG